MLTADENKKQPREPKFGTHINFSVHIKVPVKFFFHSSCHQLRTVDENENQPREPKFDTSITLRVCIKHPTQHFLHQLSPNINSCQKLMKKKSI